MPVDNVATSSQEANNKVTCLQKIHTFISYGTHH